MVIPLPARLPARAASRTRETCDICGPRPGGQATYPGACGRATRERSPIWPCSLRGLPSRPGHPGRWWALTPPFHPYRDGRLASRRGGLFSVALSFPSPGLGVTQRNALWSSDFPLPGVSPGQRPSEPLRPAVILTKPRIATQQRVLRYSPARFGDRMPGDITLEKDIPCSVEAERSVLGAILIENTAINRAQEILKEEDFYREPHRKIFKVMSDLSEKTTAIDPVTVKEELSRAGVLEAVGGPAYIASLLDGVPRSANVEYYARIVKEKSILRNLIVAGGRIVSTAYEASQDPDDILDQSERMIFQIAQDRLREGFVPMKTIDDKAGISVLEMRAQSRRLKMEQGLDLVVIDYMQLIRSRGRFENRQQEMAEISRSLKELAKELNVPVIAVSQLSRAPEQRGEKGRPQLSDLRESGAIEQDADVVLLLYREEMYKPTEENRGIATVNIGKQRNGPTAEFDMAFIREYTRFEDLERQPG